MKSSEPSARQGGYNMNALEENATPLEYQTEENQMTIVGFWIFLAAEMALFGT